MFHVEVEPTSLCNTRCFHCPHETISRPMGKMDWETYQSIMDKILAHKSRISVQYAGMGEPLLNSLIFQFIRYVADRGAATYLTTNGAALTEKNVQGLIDAGLSQVTISFNGIYKLQYELMMGGLNFERAERYLIDTIRMVESTTLKVAANVSVTKQTESNLADIKRYLVDAGVEEIYFSKCHNRGGNLKNPHVCTTPPPPKADKRCDIFANTLFVAWTGDVLSCCHDLSGAAKIGNLVTEEFESILHRKHVISQKGVDFDICKGCNDMVRFIDDPTPDGAPLSDWIYSLYANEDQRTERLAALIQELQTRVSEKDKAVNTLTAELDEKQRIIEAQSAEIAEIRRSRSWRIAQFVQRLRLWIAPYGSWQERLMGLKSPPNQNR